MDEPIRCILRSLLGSTLRIYLLCVATLGVYSLRWYYRAAREHSGRNSTDAAFWALASTAAPFASLFLYDFVAQAGRRLEREGGRAPTAWVAAALQLVLAGGLVLSPLRSLWLPGFVLFPIPIAIAHAQLEGVARSRRAVVAGNSDAAAGEAPPRLRRFGRLVGHVAVLLLGAPLLWLVATELDASGMRMLRAQARDGAVLGTQAGYSLQLESKSWRLLDAGTVGDEESDLELATEDLRSWVVVYVHDTDGRIDDIVDQRRLLIEEGTTLTEFDERRFFLPDGDLLPASLARYSVGGSPLTRGYYTVMTARLEDGIVEVVGYSDMEEVEAEVATLVSSLSPRARPRAERSAEQGT